MNTTHDKLAAGGAAKAFLRVNAAGFHPMRGHVSADVRVFFSNGAILDVQPDGIGWALFDQSGNRVSAPALDAWQLTAAVVQIDASSSAHDSLKAKA